MRTVIKYPGSKWSYADWIVSFLPKHKFYVEPYFGSGAVFFHKPAAAYETVNDLDGLVVNFFKACRDYPEKLSRAIALTPYARQEYEEIREKHSGETIQLTGDCVEDARRFCIRCCQGFGAKMANRTGWRNTKHSKGPINPQVWGGIPDAVLQIAQRLKHAQIEQADAVELIKACNGSDCLVYADPPYLGEVRGNSRLYRKEMMSQEEHGQLLDALLLHKGPVILSGYDNELYNQKLQGWHKEQKTGFCNSAKKCVEILWMNFEYQLHF